MAIHKLLTNETQQSVLLFERALRLARALGDPEAIYRSADKCVHWVHSFEPEEAVLEVIRDVRTVSRQGVNAITLGSFLWWSAFRCLTFADRAQAEDLVAEVAALAVRTRDPGLLWRGFGWRVIELTLDGDLEGSLHAADRLEAESENLGIAVLGKVQGALLRLRPRLSMGLPPTAADAHYVVSSGPTELILGPARAQFGQADLARGTRIRRRRSGSRFAPGEAGKRRGRQSLRAHQAARPVRPGNARGYSSDELFARAKSPRRLELTRLGQRSYRS